MEKLKKVIEEYYQWKVVSIYIERIETHLELDFSISIENAKALLETVGKEICNKNGRVLSASSKVNGVLKNAFSSMGYSNTKLVNQVSSALATIAQQVGDLRNEVGATSHGKSLKEIEERNTKVDTLTREFLIDTVEMVSVFLIRTFESKRSTLVKKSEKVEDTLDYLDAEEFNTSWDDSFGEFTMGDYSYTASEILFNVDKQAYATEYNNFIDAPDE